MYLQNLFPVAIGNLKNPDHLKIENSLIKECSEIKNKIKKGGNNWDADLYNTFGTFDLNESKKFKNLNKWIFEKVNQYANAIGYVNKNVKCKESWFNYSIKNDYQEKHEHYPYDISAVYYLSVPENSGNIKFYTHEPQGVKENFVKENFYTWTNYYMKPEPGLLLIFKSNLTHGVSKNKSDKPRISLAYNFKVL